MQGAIPGLVVGVGASAGGLEAFRELLSAVRPPTGMAFLLVQHVDPARESLLGGLLASCTAMTVQEARQGVTLRAETVYLIAPDTLLAVRDGTIEITPPTRERGVPLPIDHLFRSLARDFGPRAAGIILSGAGSDGCAGVRAIQAAGGLTIAQDPPTASQEGMPRSAIETGAIDLVLPIAAMPEALARFDRLPLPPRTVPPGPAADGEEDAACLAALDDHALARIAARIEPHTGLNLHVYKSGTVKRRVLRRMGLAGHDNVGAYLDHLDHNEAELQAVVQDILISVTDFFRDPEAFDALRGLALGPLVAASQAGQVVRVWVPGCATGEEAYSIAMELMDLMERQDRHLTLQIFATDVDQSALAVAREGLYPPSLVEHVPAERLGKYFDPPGERGYQVRPALREAVSFAVHDLTRDPPFSRMHLVSCRNVLIYLRQQAQERALDVFHFALRPDGCLFLGPSESLGRRRQSFSTLSKAWRIYRRVGASRPLPLLRGSVRPGSARDDDAPGLRAPQPESSRTPKRQPPIGELARQAVLRARVPPTVVVSDAGSILFMHGELRPYLRFPAGDPRLDLSTLITPDLAARTRATLYRCRRDGESVVAFSSPEGPRPGRTRITATPAFELGEGVVVLSFEEVDDEGCLSAVTAGSPAPAGSVQQLEAELHDTREDLRTTVEELESSAEALRSANEQSSLMNEELQSANEELESTTEELRSLNEELSTVNGQLREKVEQIEEAHDDLSNFFASTKIATLFLDERCRIMRHTPAAEELLRVDSGDEGRFVGDIAREPLQNGLVEEAREVLSQMCERTRELLTRDGRWVARRVLPYRTESRRVEGVVVTFVDVTDLKRTSERLAVRERQQAVIARLGVRALEDPVLQSFLDQAVREVQQTLETDFCKILELQPGGDHFLLRAGVGWQPGLTSHVTVPGGMDSHAGYTLQTQEPVIVEDLAKERRFSGPPLLTEHGVKSGISCVIRGSEEPYGVLGAHTRLARGFTPEDANFLQAIATVISGAINRHQTRVRLALEGAAAKALAETDNVLDAVARIHAAAAQELGTVVGELWQPARNGALERTSLYAAPPLEAREIEESLGPARFGSDQGVPGRVFTRRRAEWLSGLQSEDHFLRAKAARRLGLTCGLALPIMAGAEVLGVLTFFATERLSMDSSLLRSLEAIGRSLGDFARRLDFERRFRMTVDSAPVGISDRSLDGRWLRVNDRLCEITGYSREELLASSILDITHPDDRAREAELYHDLCEGRRGKYTFEKRYVRKDGSVVWVNLSAALVTTPTGEPDYCVAVMEDISARKATEEELRSSENRLMEASRQKDEFIAMLGHELRNPLTAIRNAAELLKRTRPDDLRIQRTYAVLERQTRHMAKLLDGLLDVSRIVHGKIVLDRSALDLGTIVGEVARDSAERLGEGLELHTALPAEPLRVEGDAVRLAQVIDNIVSNAIKYTPPPGHIAIWLAREEDMAVLRVKDTGAGIDPALLPDLWKPFQQGRQSLERAHGGLGLGLALVRSLVELHGGTVEAHSEGPGQGAEIVIRLPVTPG